MAEPITPVTPETPAPALTLRQHIEAEAAVAPVAAPVAAAAVVADTPAAAVTTTPAEQEADSARPDAELSEAGRTLRRSRADKRTERVKSENDDLARELQRRQELRSEIERVAQAPRSPAVGGTPTGTAAPTGVDPTDVEPTFDTFQAANPNHPDPYMGAIEAHMMWVLRKEARAAQATQHEQRQHQARSEAIAEYQTRAAELRSKHSDYDTVVEPFLTTHANHPYAPAIAGFLSADPLAAQVLYHLAKHPEAAADLFAPNTNPLIALGEIKATVKGVSAPKAKSTTNAPLPPSQTVGAGATATHDNPNTRSFADHVRIENQREQERRSRGLR